MRKILILLILLVCISFTSASASELVLPSSISFQPEFPKWEEVKELIPKNSTFSVIDIDSGKSFRVQRRAGSGHADVQPLTKKDTKIMKDIYGGKWSWKRRAVLIQVRDRLIPGSMHGMPHGAGAIQNGFPGHFCIHFLESKTHRSRKSDLGHLVMILKAAGKFDEYTQDLSSIHLLNLFLTTVKNNDQDLINRISVHNIKKHDKPLDILHDIEGMKWAIKAQESDDSTLLVSTLDVKMKIYLEEIGPVDIQHTFTLIRTSPFSPWKVMIDPFLTAIQEQ